MEITDGGGFDDDAGRLQVLEDSLAHFHAVRTPITSTRAARTNVPGRKSAPRGRHARCRFGQRVAILPLDRFEM